MIIICLSGTIEAIIYKLEKCSTVLSFFDESQTFFGALGRYSEKSSYDRSIYSTLFNAPPELSRDLAKSSTVLQEPRFNMC